MPNHLDDSKAAAPITPAETAATLARIEVKLDLVLERLKWGPEPLAQWYESITHPERSEPGE